jgi:FkbM family methyltransferase
MLPRTLTAIAAALPSSLKCRMGWAKPLYTSVLAWREPFFRVETRAGWITWHIDRLTAQRHIRGAHEPHMQASFLGFLRPGSVVYDVGAHLGFHGLFCGLLVRPSGSVIAFEPDPLCAESLSRQSAVNPDPPVTVLPCALSDRSAKLHFYSSGGTGQSRIHPQGKIIVQITTVDTLLASARIPAPDLIKIDVEGHEEAVLQRAGRRCYDTDR